MTRLLSACLALLAPAAARAADAAAAPGEAADPRVMVDCTVTNKGRPAALAAGEQIASGIVYEERVTRDQTRLELRWREVSARRWAGRSQVPPDLERCTPLLMEGAAVLVRCRQPADSGVERHRLVRLSPGQPPAVLAPSLILTGRTTLQPLGPGRLLAWVEPPEGAPPEISADEVTAAEIDASGAVAHYAIVSRPYTRRWPAGQAFILTKQGRAGAGDAAAESSSTWRAQWNLETHRLDFRPEKPRGRLPVCKSNPKVTETAAARLTVRGSRPWNALATLAADDAGPCLLAVASAGSGEAEGVADLAADGGHLRGRVWLVSAQRRRHPKGGTLMVPQITAIEVSCQLP